MNGRKCLFLTVFLLIISILIMSGISIADDSVPIVPGVGEEFRPRMQALLDWLDTNPPLVPNDPERKERLLTIDDLFMLENSPQSPVAADFFKARIAAFFKSFEAAEVKQGAEIWKLYNHSAVVKTPETTFVFDLIGGFGAVAWPPEELDRLLKSVDIMFISHCHGDHIDPRVARTLIQAGKTVVVPPGLWENEDFFNKLTVVRSGEHRIGPLNVLVYPAFQKETINNIYVITTDTGFNIMHTGDENEFYSFSREWYRSVKNPPRIDAMLVNCWSPDLRNLVNVFKPSIVVSMHEHEIGHPVSGRRPYSFVYAVFDPLKDVVSVLIPAWGESISIPWKPPGEMK